MDKSYYFPFLSRGLRPHPITPRSLNLALELSKEEPEYEEIGCKFYEHFIQIASAMDRMGINKDELYNEEDGFYYDLLRLPGGRASRLKLRSLVGLLPIAASMVVSDAEYSRLPRFGKRSQWLTKRYPEITCNVTNIDKVGYLGNRMLSVITPETEAHSLTDARPQ